MRTLAPLLLALLLLAIAGCGPAITSVGTQAAPPADASHAPPPGQQDHVGTSSGHPKIMGSAGDPNPATNPSANPPQPSQGAPDSCGTSIPRDASDMSTWYVAGSDPSKYRSSFFSRWDIGSMSSTIASDAQWGVYGTSVPDLQRFLGHRVRYSAVVWGSRIALQAGLFMGVGGADNRYLAFDDMESRALSGEPSENRYQIVLDVDRSAHWISLGIWLTGRGSLFVTDPILEIVDSLPPAYMPDPSGWLISGSAPQDYSIGLDDSTMRCARPSGRIASGPRQPSGFATLLQVVSADAYRGQRVRMSGWVRTEHVGFIAGLWLRGDDEHGQSRTFDNMSDRPISGTQDWAPYSIVLDIPSNVASLFYGMYLDGAGTAWVDGVAFDIVDDSIPVTRESLP